MSFKDKTDFSASAQQTIYPSILALPNVKEEVHRRMQEQDQFVVILQNTLPESCNLWFWDSERQR